MSGVVKLSNGVLDVEIWTLGARLNGLWFDGLGSLVDGASSRDEALGAKKYVGAVVGPVANRIAGGKASIDGHSCAFEKNENGITTLHSGSTGVHARDWSIEARNETSLSLSLRLEDGDGGFPGNRLLTARYDLEGADLRVRFGAETDAPTWVNLALHPYWALGMTGRAGQRMSVNADRYLPVTAETIPTGEVAEVTGTPFDLREIGVPSFAIDHNYCLNDSNDAAVVVESDAGVRLEVRTDAPGVQVFTGKDIGIAIEPQHWPDAMHHPGFPPIDLGPGARYGQNSLYQFSRI